MLDVWRLNLDEKSQYWEHPAPSQLRQLYREVLNGFSHSGSQSTDRFKVLVFKSMARLLDGANPLTTWQHLSRQCVQIMNEIESTTGVVQSVQAEMIKRLKEDIDIASNSKSTD